MKSSVSNVAFLALFLAICEGLTLHWASLLGSPPDSGTALIERNDFGFDPESFHGTDVGGGDPLSGGFDTYKDDHPTEKDPKESLDGSKGGNSKVKVGGSVAKDGIVVSNGVASIDLGDGVEASYNEASDTTEVDVSKVCKVLKRRRRGLLSARDKPCFTTAQFPEVVKYNDVYKATKKQADKFYSAQIAWTSFEVERVFKGIDLSNVVPIEPYSGIRLKAVPDSADSLARDSDSDVIIPADFTKDQLIPEPGTAQSPNTALLRDLTPKQALDLYVRQTQALEKVPGIQIDDLLRIQQKWCRYLDINPERFLEQNHVVAKVDSPMLQIAPEPELGNSATLKLRLPGDPPDKVYEAVLPIKTTFKHLDIDLKSEGLKPKLAVNMITEYNKLLEHYRLLSHYGDRATRTLEKTAGLREGTLYKLFERVEAAKDEALSKGSSVPPYREEGYVIKTVGNKIIIQSQPMTMGTKVALGVGVTVVVTAAGYEFVWDK